MELTVDVDVHDGTRLSAGVVSANALAIIRVPEVNPATSASGEKKVAILVVLHARERAVVTLEQDRPARNVT